MALITQSMEHVLARPCCRCDCAGRPASCGSRATSGSSRSSAAGDEGAFEALYDRHHPAILGFCRHMLGIARGGRGRRPAHLPVRVPRPRRVARSRSSCARGCSRSRATAASRRCARAAATPRSRLAEPATDGLAADGRAPGGPARAAHRPRTTCPRTSARRCCSPSSARSTTPGSRRPRLPEGEGEGARVPGAHLARRQPRSARHAVRRDPRSSSRPPAARALRRGPAAPPPAHVRRLPRLQGRGRDAAQAARARAAGRAEPSAQGQRPPGVVGARVDVERPARRAATAGAAASAAGGTFGGGCLGTVASTGAGKLAVSFVGRRRGGRGGGTLAERLGHDPAPEPIAIILGGSVRAQPRVGSPRRCPPSRRVPVGQPRGRKRSDAGRLSARRSSSTTPPPAHMGTLRPRPARRDARHRTLPVPRVSRSRSERPHPSPASPRAADPPRRRRAGAARHRARATARTPPGDSDAPPGPRAAPPQAKAAHHPGQEQRTTARPRLLRRRATHRTTAQHRAPRPTAERPPAQSRAPASDAPSTGSPQGPTSGHPANPAPPTASPARRPSGH